MSTVLLSFKAVHIAVDFQTGWICEQTYVLINMYMYKNKIYCIYIFASYEIRFQKGFLCVFCLRFTVLSSLHFLFMFVLKLFGMMAYFCPYMQNKFCQYAKRLSTCKIIMSTCKIDNYFK